MSLLSRHTRRRLGRIRRIASEGWNLQAGPEPERLRRCPNEGDVQER